MTAAAATVPALSRYGAIAATALRQRLAERGAIAGRLVFYAVILLIFWRLWEVVLARGAIGGAGAREFLWYLALTEWVVLSVPPIHLEIERDVRRGEVAYRLVRPLSYLGGRLAEAAGDWGLRALTLGAGGFGLAWWFTGGLPAEPAGLLLALPLGLLAGAVTLLLVAAIGLTSFWLHDCSPVYWVWQKLAFILGGLFLPLEIYPDWLRGVAFWTPFPALIHGPGRMAFGFDPAFAAEAALRLLVWGTLGALALGAIYRRALRDLAVNGG